MTRCKAVLFGRRWPLTRALAEQRANSAIWQRAAHPALRRCRSRHCLSSHPSSHRTCGGCRCHEVDVRLKAEVAAKGMRHVDHAHPHARGEVREHGRDGLGRHLKQVSQEGAFRMEEGAQGIIDGQGQMQVRHFEQLAGSGVDPCIDSDFATTRTRFAAAFGRKTAREVQSRNQGTRSERNQPPGRGITSSVARFRARRPVGQPGLRR